MLNHPTLLAWTKDAVAAANAAPRSNIASAVTKVIDARRVEKKARDRARSMVGQYAKLIGVSQLRASLGFDSRGGLMLTSVHSANAEQRAALACIELCEATATVEVGRCRRAGCRRLLVNDFGPGARRPYWYCKSPDGASHKFNQKERNDKSNAKRAAERAAAREQKLKKRSRE